MIRILTCSMMITLTLASCRTPEKSSRVLDDDEQTGTTQQAAEPYKFAYTTTFEPEVETASPDEIYACTFNVSFVGHWKARDKRSAELARLIQPCDVVVVQELVAPPTNFGLDADGNQHHWLNQSEANVKAKYKDPEELIESFEPWWKPTKPEGIVEAWDEDYQARHFVGHMVKTGYKFVLSDGDSGTTVNHNNSTSSEWQIAFYRPEKLTPLDKKAFPGGWTMMSPNEPLARHPVFDRVPYAFGFRTLPREDGKSIDFVLISVHLHSTQTRQNETEAAAGKARAKELAQIHKWSLAMAEKFGERDYIILGDMNFVDCDQTRTIMTSLVEQAATALQDPDAAHITTLNNGCNSTNISRNEPKPFDQIIFNRKHTTEIVRSQRYGADAVVVELPVAYDIEANFGGSNGNFVKAYSDHNPVLFTLKIQADDD